MGVHQYPSESSPASAWTGTHFIFELAEDGDAQSTPNRITTLDFLQVGYDEQSEFFEFNKGAWGQVMQNLKRVVQSQG